MRFLVSEIRSAPVVEREESVSAQDLIGAPPAFVSFRQPVKTKVQARMTRDGEIIFLGRIATVITYQCGRCLEFFDHSVDLDFEQVISTEELEVDITAEIRETLLVDLPVRAICREDCRGICATCGKNLNNVSCDCPLTPVGTRWNALKSFPFK